ncbi:MAG: hypothetical protein QOK10_276 [Pseudonocardiales bacterium]|nr:hypothetical protein [Pseudonocardiales bacterium]
MAEIVAGWYSDPAGGPALRWWDGQQWTNHVKPSQPEQFGYAPAPTSFGTAQGDPGATQGWAGAVGQTPQSYPGAPPLPQYYTAPQAGYAPNYGAPAGQQPGTILQQNRYSAITVAVAILYAILAIGVHIVVIGVLPILFCVRAFRAREPYRVAAAVAAAAAVIFALTMLAR